MVTAAFGRPGYWFLTFAQFLFPFFAMAGYVVITGDTFSRILRQIAPGAPDIVYDEVLIKTVMVVAVMMPISMLRNIARLEKVDHVMTPVLWSVCRLPI